MLMTGLAVAPAAVPDVIAAPVHHAASSNTLVIAVDQNPDSLNELMYIYAVDQKPMELIYDGLYDYNYLGQYTPALATSYTESKNGLTWTFQLRHGVKWSDGQPFTSKDVWWTWKEITMPGVDISYAAGWNNISSVDTPNPYEVVFHLSKPYGPFMSSIGSWDWYGAQAIVPYHILGHMTAAQLNHASYNDAPIGTGPYVLQKWVQNSSLTFVRNPYYWGPKPKIAKIVFEVIPSTTTEMLDLETGQVDIASVPSADLAQAKTWPAVKVVPTITPTYEEIELGEGLFLKQTPVRLALTHLTPKEQIVSSLLHGNATIAWGDQVPGGNYYDPSLPHVGYDPALAVKELEQAGFKKVPAPGSPAGYYWQKDGKILTVPIWAMSGIEPDDEIVQVVAKSWAQYGVKTSANTESVSILFSAKGPLYHPGKDAAVIAYWGQGPLPYDGEIFNSKYKCPPGDNCGHYSNPLMDKATNAETNASPAQLKQLADEVQKLEISTAPAIFLYWEPDNIGMSVHVHGYIETPNGFSPPWMWSLS